MPSRLHLARNRPQVVQVSRQMVPQQVPIGAPWRGFEPDLNQGLTTADSLDSMQNFVVRGEKLELDDGWQELTGATNVPPFGHDDTSTEYTDGVTTYGAALFSASTSGGPPFTSSLQGLIRIDEFPRIIFTTGLSHRATMVVTGRTGRAFTARTEAGHLFELDAGGVWRARPFNTANGVGATIVALEPILATLSITGTTDAADDLVDADLPDSDVYPFGVTGATNKTTNTVQDVDESVFIWVSSADDIFYFPRSTGVQEYTSYENYATQLNDYAAENSGDGVGTSTTLTSLKAKSLANFQGRVAYFNTIEVESGVTRYLPQRVRWSIIGNPLVVDPNYVSDAGGTPEIIGTGAGFVDFTEFNGEGLRIEEIGDRLACYFEDGVALLERTLIPDAAFTKRIVTTRRGLISTHALSNIGGGVHFGIFTDGWYLMNNSGRWEEVGTKGASTSELFQRLSGVAPGRLDTEVQYKWKEFFYDNLNQAAQHRVYCSYDARNKFVRIAWPEEGSVRNNNVWVYDVRNDRVFPHDYNISTGDQNPTCWGLISPLANPALLWDQATDTWDASPGEGDNAWDDLQSDAANRQIAHGTSGGRPFVHIPEQLQVDGTAVNWDFTTKPSSWGLDPFLSKTLDRLWVEREAGAQTITVTAFAEQSQLQAGGVLSFDTAGSFLNKRVAHTDFRLTGHHFSLAMVGSGKPGLLSMRAQVLVPESRLGEHGGEGD